MSIPRRPGCASAPRSWTVPSRRRRATFRLHDALGRETHHFGSGTVSFTPGSAAINVLDGETGAIRAPITADYVRYAKVVGGLRHIASQSTAFIPADVPSAVSDSYRLFLSLLYGEKPVVTGAFTIEAFEVMRDLQVVVRGGEAALRERPLAVFSCCPTAPLKWSDVTSQNVVDCARSGIPVEFISMPLAGFMSPVTLVGSLVQHTAETLSGLVISQLAAAGRAHPVGRVPGHLRHPLRDHADGRRRDDDDRLRLHARSATPWGCRRRPTSA